MLGASKILSNPKKAVNSHGGKIYAIEETETRLFFLFTRAATA